MLLLAALVGSPAAWAQDVTVTGEVWLDRDGDGLLGAEHRIPGVRIYAEVTLGQVVGEALTDELGSYTISNLPSGGLTLYVDASTLPGGVDPTYEEDGFLDGQFYSSNPPSSTPLVNWGFQGRHQISGTVFEDLDSDGLDAGEQGLDGALVFLTGLTHDQAFSHTTGPDGTFSFDGLYSDTWDVAVDWGTLVGYNAVTEPDPIVDNMSAVTLDDANSSVVANFGFNDGAVLSGRVFLDLSPLNGGIGSEDMGLVGITMLLLDDQDNLLTTVDTTAGGAYRFDNLAPGTYRVWVDSNTLPPSMLHTYDPDGSLNRQETRTVTVGDWIWDLHFGFTGDGQIGQLVLLDLDANGQIDPGDSGLDGVSVTLTDLVSGETSAFDTQGGGAYVFAGLPVGTYRVEVDPSTVPAGLQPAWDRDGTPDHKTDVNLAISEVVNDATFSYNGQGVLEGTVYADDDLDGQLELGELGIEAVYVTLLDDLGNLVGIQSTNAAGQYTFANLLAGTYTLMIDVSGVLPPEAQQTGDPDGVLDDQTQVVLTTGQTVANLDFGYLAASGIFGGVFEDANGDGSPEGSEQGLPNIRVQLFDATDVFLTEVLTDGSGSYLFEPLGTGSYIVRVDPSTLPPNMTQTFDDDGLATPHEIAISLPPASVVNGNFGYVGPGGFFGGVFDDADLDGLQSPGDVGIPNVQVEILDGTGAVFTVLTTDGAGLYSLDGLLPGTYGARVDPSTLPPNMTQSYDTDGLSTPNEVVFSVDAGVTTFGIDFGYQQPGGFDGAVFDDADLDGLPSPGDVGIPNVQVEILDGTGAVFTVLLTDGSGFFSLDGLLPGSYGARVDPSTLPPNMTQSFDTDGLSTPNEVAFTVGTGTITHGIEFGYQQPGGFDGAVFDDADLDGLPSPGDVGIANVQVEILDGTGAVFTVLLTDGSGFFSLDGLLPGTYGARVDPSTLPPNMTQSYDTDGLSTPNEVVFTVGTGTITHGIEFGYQQPGGFDGAVFDDADLDGLPSPGDVGIANVQVEILDGTGAVFAVLLTDGSGFFSLDGLLPGSYGARVDPATLPPNMTQSFDTDGLSTPNEVAFTVSTGTITHGIEFGYQQPGGFDGAVFDDADLDGLPSPADVGIANVQVEILDGTGAVFAVLLTDGSGFFSLDGLLPGTYGARVDPATLPPNVTQSYDADGLSTPNEVAFTVGTGTITHGIEFGYQQPGGFDGAVFDDADLDGLPSPGDVGIANVQVEILDGTGAVFTVLLTDGSGFFSLDGLLPGSYGARVDPATLPPNMTQSYDADGLSTPNEVAFTVGTGTITHGIEFGYAIAGDPDLAGHWRLDEGAGNTALDSSANGNDGTWSGGLTPVAGFLGNGLDFDGQSGVVEVPASPSLDSLTTVTMTAWIRHTTSGGWRSIVDKRDNSNDGFDLYINNQSRLFIRINDTTLSGSLTVADGNWHHVAGVYDGSTMRLYVDGVADGTRNIGAVSLSTTAPLLLGENYARGNSFYAGTLDDVRVYSRALTAVEIDDLVQEGLLANDTTPPVRSNGLPSGSLTPGTTDVTLSLTTGEDAECRWSTSAGVDFGVMTGTFDTPFGTSHSRDINGLAASSYAYYVRCEDLAGNANGDDYAITFSIAEPGDLTSGLMGFWPFENGSGTTADDLSGNGNAGTLANGPTWTTGQVGGALTLDGIDDAVTYTAAPELDDFSEITLSAWVNHSATTGWRSIIDKRDGAFDGYDLYISSSGRLFMRVNNQTLQGTTVVADGTWHHVVGVYDGNQMLLYVDGVLDASATVGSLTIDTWRTLRLGENWELGNSFFAGTMDEVRIYDRALDAGEVAELTTRTLQP